MSKFKIGYQAAGYFGASVIRDGNKIDLFKRMGHKDGKLRNIILNSGITAFLNSVSESAGSQYGYLQLGTDSTAASAAQTALINRTHGGGNGSKITGKTKGYNTDDGYLWTIASYTFGKGDVQGNFYEIGSAPAATGNCFSRARIEDSGGNPVALTVGADDVLTLTYELRCWIVFPSSHVINYDDDGTPASTTVSYALGSNSDLVASGSPQNAYFNAPTVTVSMGAAATGTTRDVTFSYSTTQGNPSISSFAMGKGSSTSFLPNVSTISFSPAIPKTNEFTVDIDAEISFTRKV